MKRQSKGTKKGQASKVASLFEYRLEKGDILGAIDHAIAESEQASALAQQALDDIEKMRCECAARASAALAKYPLL